MPDDAGGKRELRCFCSRSPLLAVYGVDTKGRLFIHVKVYKQSKIYAELMIRGGEVSLKCRECYRWYNIFIKEENLSLRESIRPPELQNPEESNAGDGTELHVV